MIKEGWWTHSLSFTLMHKKMYLIYINLIKLISNLIKDISVQSNYILILCNSLQSSYPGYSRRVQFESLYNTNLIKQKNKNSTAKEPIGLHWIFTSVMNKHKVTLESKNLTEATRTPQKWFCLSLLGGSISHDRLDLGLFVDMITSTRESNTSHMRYRSFT